MYSVRRRDSILSRNWGRNVSLRVITFLLLNYVFLRLRVCVCVCSESVCVRERERREREVGGVGKTRG